MVLKLRKHLGLLLFFVLTLCFSCEEQGIFFDCSDCNEEEPVETNIHIKLDSNNHSPLTEIKVYEGNIEDNILYRTLLTNETETTILVNINKKYTITAAYAARNNVVYIAVDAAFPRVKYDEEQCDNPCYYVYDNKVNLKLKYQ